MLCNFLVSMIHERLVYLPDLFTKLLPKCLNASSHFQVIQPIPVLLVLLTIHYGISLGNEASECPYSADSFQI
jgi:hypothetical protein